MAISVYDERRLRAWNLQYRTALNDCYWKEIIHHKERAKTRITWIIALVGLSASLIIYFLNAPRHTPLISASATAIFAILNQKKERKDSKEARHYYVLWSNLYYDAARFWETGEACDWRKPKLETRLVQLEEREKGVDSKEQIKQDDKLVRDCQRMINERFAQKEKTDGKPEASTTTERDSATQTPGREACQQREADQRKSRRRASTKRSSG